MLKVKSIFFMMACLSLGVETWSNESAREIRGRTDKLITALEPVISDLDQYHHTIKSILGTTPATETGDDGVPELVVDDYLGVDEAIKRFHELRQCLNEDVFPVELQIDEFGPQRLPYKIPFSLWEKDAHYVNFGAEVQQRILIELSNVFDFLQQVQNLCQSLPTDQQVREFENEVDKNKSAIDEGDKRYIQHISQKDEAEQQKLYLYYILKSYVNSNLKKKQNQFADATMPEPDYAAFVRGLNLWHETNQNYEDLYSQWAQNWFQLELFVDNEFHKTKRSDNLLKTLVDIGDQDNQSEEPACRAFFFFWFKWFKGKDRLIPFKNRKSGPEPLRLKQTLENLRIVSQNKQVASQFGNDLNTVARFLEKAISLDQLMEKAKLWKQPLDRLKRVASSAPLQSEDLKILLRNLPISLLDRLTPKQCEEMGFPADQRPVEEQRTLVKEFFIQILKGKAQLESPVEEQPFFKYVVLPAIDLKPEPWWPTREHLSNSYIYSASIEVADADLEVIKKYLIEEEKKSLNYASSLDDYFLMMTENKRKNVFVIDGEVGNNPTFNLSFSILTTDDRWNRFRYLNPGQLCLKAGAHLSARNSVWAFDVPEKSINELLLRQPSQVCCLADVFLPWIKNKGNIRMSFPMSIKSVANQQELRKTMERLEGQAIKEGLWVSGWGSDSCTFWTTKDSGTSPLSFLNQHVAPWLSGKFRCDATFISWNDFAESELSAYLPKNQVVLTLTKR